MSDKQLKKHTNGRYNISVNKEVHREFEYECYMNDVTMSGTIEQFMVSYVRMSKKLKEENEKEEARIPG